MPEIATRARARRCPLLWAPIEYTATVEPRNGAPFTSIDSAMHWAATTNSPERSGNVRRQ